VTVTSRRPSVTATTATAAAAADDDAVSRAVTWSGRRRSHYFNTLVTHQQPQFNHPHTLHHPPHAASLFTDDDYDVTVSADADGDVMSRDVIIHRRDYDLAGHLPSRDEHTQQHCVDIDLQQSSSQQSVLHQLVSVCLSVCLSHCYSIR